MRPIKEEHTVVSNVEGRKVPMGIRIDAHMQKVLTDLYSDNEMAVLREYATNAYDSHIEAGNSAPIEVFLPTPLNPALRIKDYGVGLSADEIATIYSIYGVSTKRDSDEVTGSMGLGCKSGLAYNNQFTLVAVKNGFKTSASVSRDEDGVGSFVISDPTPTNEPNGVEVIIPAKVDNSFAAKAAHLFSFWPEGSVVVNGKEPEKIDGLRISDDILLRKSSVRDLLHSYVVMGNVPYRVDRDQFNFELPQSWQLVVRVPMGSVRFPPNREELTFSNITNATLLKVKEQYKAGIQAAIQREIDAAPSFPEAAKTWLNWYEFMPKKHGFYGPVSISFTYRGQKIPQQFYGSFILSSTEQEFNNYGKLYRVSTHDKHTQIPLGMAHNAIWVEGFDRAFTATVKKRLWKYCELNSIDYNAVNFFILTKDMPINAHWLPKPIAWAKVAQIKLPRAKRSENGGPSAPAVYNAYVGGDNRVEHHMLEEDDIDTSMPIYYVITKFRSDAERRAQILAKIEDGFTLVYLYTNREAKFTRLFPQAQKADSVIQEAFQWWYESYLNEIDRFLITLHADEYWLSRNPLNYLPLRGIDDPMLQDAVRKVRDPQVRKRVNRLARVKAMFAEFAQGHSRRGIDKLADEVLTPYPLCANFTHYYDDAAMRQWRKHATVYINAIYRQMQETMKGR